MAAGTSGIGVGLTRSTGDYYQLGDYVDLERNKKRKQFEDQEKTNSEAKKLKRCDPCDIYIAYLPERFRESDLRNLFEEYGIEISNIRFIRYRNHP